MANLNLKELNINGSDLSGSNGEANRTYDTGDSELVSTDMAIYINGLYLHQGTGKDYTVSGDTITFLNAIFDTQIITIMYYQSKTVSSQLSPYEESISGSDLSGNDGETSRSYTLRFGSISTVGIRISVNGTFQHRGSSNDYTRTGNIITFVNAIGDSAVITISYYTNLYCSYNDVKRILQQEFSYSTSTNPTQAQVEEHIEEAQAEIDNITQHAWRETQVSDEYYDLPIQPNPMADITSCIEVYLRHRAVKTIDSDAGDKIEIWNGSSWIDWADTKTQGRANDYWVDEEQGLLFLNYHYAYFRRKGLRMTYRYGENNVSADIRKCCAMMVAIRIVSFDDNSANLNETGDPTRSPYDQRIAQMSKEIERILNNRQEFFTI